MPTGSTRQVSKRRRLVAADIHSGAWLIHPVLILLCKLLVDAIPGLTQDVGWTVINLGYMAVSFLMFHHVTGVPFESQ
jgi:hypothetical protein